MSGELLVCRNRVSDFARWKTIFDSHREAQRAAGLRLSWVRRGVEDPDQVYFLFEVESLEGAKGFLEDPAAAEAGLESGVVDGEFHFIGESLPDG